MARQVVTGDKELRLALQSIPVITNRGLDGVIKVSFEPMRQQAVSNALPLRQPGRAPKGGHLDQGIVTRKVKSRGRTYREFWLGFVRRARRIAHLVELGTAPHAQPNRGIFHPGATPRPFFIPAYDSKKAAVVTAISRGTWGLVQSAALQFGRRR